MLLLNFVIPLCSAAGLEHSMQQQAENALNMLGLKCSSEMSMSFFSLATFSYMNLSKLKQAGQELVASSISKSNEIPKMFDDLMSSKSNNIMNEISKIVDNTKSTVLKDLYGHLTKLLNATIEANRDFSIKTLLYDSELYTQVPIEYRALAFMCATKAKTVLGLYSSMYTGGNAAMDIYKKLEMSRASAFASQFYEFLSKDVSKNFLENSEMKNKKAVVEKYSTLFLTKLINNDKNSAKDMISKVMEFKNVVVEFHNEVNSVKEEESNERTVL